MDEIIINIIGAFVVAIISVVITIIVKNGWETHILNVWNEMRDIYDAWKPILHNYDDTQLFEEIEELMNSLEEAFADSELTLKEFNAIRKSGMPLWNRFLEFAYSH